MNETTLKLSAEEQYELKQALEANITRERKAVDGMRDFPAMTGPGGVIERAVNSINVLTSILGKLS
jgi:hypothetical protein